MMHDASIRRTLAAAVAMAVVGLTAASAQAAIVTDDLTGGTHDHTVLADNAVAIGAFDEAFNGAALPTGWAQTPWAAGGVATVGTGAMTVDGTRVDSIVPAGPGSSLRFRATFDSQPFQHVGFATTFDGTPWALFSTGSGGTGVVARTSDGTTETVSPEVATTTFAHDFRIDWTPTAIVYYVDGTQVASHPVALTVPMTAQASDTTAVPPTTFPLTVDSMGLRLKTTGTFTSKVLNAGDPRVADMTFTPQSDTTGGTISYELRSGSTATPGAGWSAWGTPAATPQAQYVQYRATLTTTDIATSPKLTGAAVDFNIDSTAPAVTMGTITTSGKSATVPFTSNDAGATYTCSLDGKPFVACKSPAKFDGLAVGSHGVSVRATDKFGNQRTVSSSFTIKAPPPVGSPTSPTAPDVDVKAPRMAVPRKLAMSANGKVRLSLVCPTDETKCVVKVKLRRHGATVASKTVKLNGGQTRIVSLRVKRSVRRVVENRGSVKLTLKVSARDAADNTWTKSKKVTLKPVV